MYLFHPGIHKEDNSTDEISSSILLAELKGAKDAPVELGEVEWIRNFDEATTKAKKLNKPLLVLFQEVPGCSTSSGYGKNVLSRPLLLKPLKHSLFRRRFIIIIRVKMKGC
jgi:hypothetical protein